MTLPNAISLAEAQGTIALPTSEIGRFTLFTVSLASTARPDGTNLSVMASASVTENINASIRTMRATDRWLWIMGDDHVWPNDCLMNLLETMDAHEDIDILVPLVVKRNPPWHLVVFHEAGVYEDDTYTLSGSSAKGYPRWKPFDWNEIPSCGVFEVDAAGSAGMVIRREVLDKIGDPWFQSTDGVFLNEDVMFCMAAKQHGFRIFATADIVMGHMGIFNVRPIYRKGRWGALAEFSSPEEQYRHLFMPDVEGDQTGAGAMSVNRR